MKVMTAAWALPLLGFCGAVSCGVSESVTPSASGTDDAASDAADSGTKKKTKTPKEDGGAPLVEGWSRKLGGAERSVGLRVARSGNDDLFVAGEFGGTIDCGGIAVTGAGGTDAFLAVMSAAGVVTSCLAIGGEGDESPVAMRVDEAGNAYIALWFLGSLDLGFGVWESADDFSSVVLKRTPGGTWAWAKLFQGALINDLALTATGVSVVGSFSGQVNLGAGNVSAVAGDDAFVSLLDGSKGTTTWVKTFGSTGKDSATAVAIDSAGRSVVVGKFESTLSLGASSLVSAGGFDAFMMTLDSVGKVQNALNFGGADGQSAESLALDADDNRIISGGVSGSIHFSADQSIACGSCTYLAKFTPDGTPLFGKSVGAGVKYGNVNVNANGEIGMGGAFGGSFSVGQTTLSHGAASGLDFDGFVAVWKGDGSPLYASQGGGSGSIGNVVWTSSGDLVAAGGFTTKLTLCGATLTGSDISSAFGVLCPRSLIAP